MATCRLTFKKAFGIKYITTEQAFWLSEIQAKQNTYTIRLKNTYEISVGRFGRNDEEKHAISLFLHSEERDLKLISEMRTLDISFEVDLSIPDSILSQSEKLSVANDIVKPYIHDAFRAANYFVDGYREVQYRLHRGTPMWSNNEILFFPQLTETEFQTYLFYVLQTNESSFVGCFSVGRGISTFSLSPEFLQETLNNEVPFERKLLVKAWEYFFQEDYRSTIIYTATVIELVIKDIVTNHLTSKSVTNQSRIAKFADQTSNRLLSTVILGLLNIGNESLREGLSKVFEIRNEIVHHRRREVKRKEAVRALERAEELLNFISS